MMVPSLDGPKHPTMDDVKRAADEYNKIAAQSAAAGLQQGLHNEDFEMTSVDGKRTYDLLLDLLIPKLVKFQFQISTISRGFDAADYFTRYPWPFHFDARPGMERVYQENTSPSGKARSTGRRSSLPRKPAASRITLSRWISR